jgi:hypothetical protein
MASCVPGTPGTRGAASIVKSTQGRLVLSDRCCLSKVWALELNRRLAHPTLTNLNATRVHIKDQADQAPKRRRHQLQQGA